MKLSHVILKAIFLVSLLFAFLAFAISMIFQYSGFQQDLIYIKNEYIQFKKDEIKREVLKVHEFIEFKQRKIREELEIKLKSRVNTAHKIAMNIYEENKLSKTPQEIQYLIVSALKNISYDEKRAYFFINSNIGQAILFNKESKLNKNNNIWNLQDVKGSFIIQKQANLALSKGEGFVTNHFIKPDLNDNIQYPKLSYIKKFAPFNWHIGIGEYLDDFEHEVQKEILDWVATIRYGIDGYIFVNSTKRKALIFDGKRLEVPKHYGNDKLYKMQMNAISNKNGDFFFYKFKKLNTIKEYPKMGYAKQYEKWGWIVGSGVYIDEVDAEVARKEDLLISTVLKQVTTSIALIILLALVIFLISKRISGVININILNLMNAFKRASTNNEQIDIKKLTYKEFTILAKSLNETLSSRNEVEAKLQDYIKIVNDNVIISSTDRRGIIQSVSEAFCKISGYSKEELIGKSHNIVRHPDMTKEFYKDMWQKLQSGFPWSGEIKNRRKNGTAYWVSSIIHPNFEDGELIGYTAIREDITDKKKIEYLSITDDLTLLYNRRYFNTRVEEELNRAKREKHHLSFLMLDVDYFKKYNDTYGHHAGDQALQAVAKVLRKYTKRPSDFAFRLGGEEFGVLCSFEDEKHSLELANFIRCAVEELRIEHKNSEASKYLTISIGVVSRSFDKLESSVHLYKDADESLYKAKEQGRNCIYLQRLEKES